MPLVSANLAMALSRLRRAAGPKLHRVGSCSSDHEASTGRQRRSSNCTLTVERSCPCVRARQARVKSIVTARYHREDDVQVPRCAMVSHASPSGRCVCHANAGQPPTGEGQAAVEPGQDAEDNLIAEAP